MYWCAGVQGHVDRKEEALPEPHLPGLHVQDKHLRDGILRQRGLVSILTSIRHAMIQPTGAGLYRRLCCCLLECSYSSRVSQWSSFLLAYLLTLQGSYSICNPCPFAHRGTMLKDTYCRWLSHVSHVHLCCADGTCTGRRGRGGSRFHGTAVLQAKFNLRGAIGNTSATRTVLDVGKPGTPPPPWRYWNPGVMSAAMFSAGVVYTTLTRTTCSLPDSLSQE